MVIDKKFYAQLSVFLAECKENVKKIYPEDNDSHKSIRETFGTLIIYLKARAKMMLPQKDRNV